MLFFDQPPPAIIIPKPPGIIIPDPALMTAFVQRKKLAGGNDSFTKLLLHNDGSAASTVFTDSSVGGAHGTATTVGDAQVTTSNAKFAQAMICTQAGGGYIQYANHADWDLGTTGGGHDFTIDFWVYLTSRNSGAGAACLISSSDHSANGWELYSTAANMVLVHAGATSATIAYGLALTTLTHIAIVRNGTTITLYVGGTSQGTFADADLNNGSQVLRVGAFGGGSPLPSGITLDEVRLSKGIARWTANFTPPTVAYF